MVKIFVGNIAEGVTDSDLREVFEKHGKVTECDVLGSYGFVHVETETEAEAAIVALDKHMLRGQPMNVEKSKGSGVRGLRGVSGGGGGAGSFRLGGGGAFPGGGGAYMSSDYGTKAARRAGCTKLHIANLPETVQSNELRELFERYGYVAECDVVEDRKIAFVHIEDSASEAAIQGLNGCSFKGMSLKVQLSKNQSKPSSGSSPGGVYPPPPPSQYTPNMYNASGTGGSGGMIPTIQGRGRGIAGIPVRTARVPMPVSAYPPASDPMSRAYGIAPNANDNRYAAMSYNAAAAAAAAIGANGNESYAEHNLPPPAKDRIELLDLLDRRRRLESLDPYERRLIACTDPYNLPPPPPDFVRLLRERALVKARLPVPPNSRSAIPSTLPAAGGTMLAGVPPSYTSGKISAPPVAYTSMYAQRSSAGY